MREFLYISGRREGKRIPSRVLEEIIHQQVVAGNRDLEVEAFGQHGIGGRLWDAGETRIRIIGHSGQRTGSMGHANTHIEIMGPASDDVGWLNAGAEIIVHGNASNGVMNAAAQGCVYIGGSIGARGMTMTKQNPRFAPPELWVLGSAGDYFGEFMAGGTAVICGLESGQEKIVDRLVMGYRPLVGMVGGKVFVRGEPKGFSRKDAKIVAISDEEWAWLDENLTVFLDKIQRPALKPALGRREDWCLLMAQSPHEKADGMNRPSMADFRSRVWDGELGRGGLIGDLQETEHGTIPLVPTGKWRRFVPVWEQGVYAAPCQAACPTGIPAQDRWSMVRADNIDEAIAMGLNHSPFPATVCGYLCPSPCMDACTRGQENLAPIDVRALGRAGEGARAPEPAPRTQYRMAVIGGGPGGLSVAWHLSLSGHGVSVFETGGEIGGKMATVIPGSRIPQQTLEVELDRVRSVVEDIRLDQTMDAEAFHQIREAHDYVIIAAGAKKPRTLPIPGIDQALFANAFLEKAKADAILPGARVVIIGAGNVGCDVATEAHRLGTVDITLIDVQKPAAFGKEREDAEACGAQFKWPVFTEKITEAGVVLKDGSLLEADTVVVAIGDVPDLSFVEDLALDNGFLAVDALGRTSDPKVFAVGDVVGPGLITHAVGAGKRVAAAIDQILSGGSPAPEKPVIDKDRVTLAYYDPRQDVGGLETAGDQCASCGKCRDCGICVSVCPEAAISRLVAEDGEFEYRVDPDKCIGCGFCKGACPCGIWDLVPNTPL